MPQRVPPEPLPPPPAPDLRPTIAVYRRPWFERLAVRVLLGGLAFGVALIGFLETPRIWWLVIGASLLGVLIVVGGFSGEQIAAGENWVSEGRRSYIRLDRLKKVSWTVGGMAGTSAALDLRDRDGGRLQLAMEDLANAPVILRTVMRAVADAYVNGDAEVDPAALALVRQHYRPRLRRKGKRRREQAPASRMAQAHTEQAPDSEVWGEVVPGAVPARVRVQATVIAGRGVGAAIHQLASSPSRLAAIRDRALRRRTRSGGLPE